MTVEVGKRFEELWQEDPRLTYMAEHPEKPFSCHLMLDREAFRRSRSYTEVLVHTRAEYTLAVSLMDDNRTTAAMGVFREPGKRYFDKEECALLGELVPHFKRAVQLHRRLATLDFERRSALAALEHMPLGIVICEGNGTLRFANQTASEVLVNQGRLACPHPGDGAELRRHIVDAVAAAGQGGTFQGRAMAISRPGGQADLHVVVSLLWGNNCRFGLSTLDEPLAIVFITDPDRPQETSVELLQRLFGLTPREAAITNRLVLGEALEQIAETLDVTYGTARGYLKSIFLKTGTNRQAELVRLILASPLWARTQPPPTTVNGQELVPAPTE
ncbi:MAG: helix-turn-helix transcriptional regulator [Alphaproteobacteria bacterium]